MTKPPPNETPPPCKMCGKPVAWSDKKCWRKTCSRQCRLDDRRANNARFMRLPPVHKGKMTARAIDEMLAAWKRR